MTQRTGRGCHPVPSMRRHCRAQFLKSKPLFGPPTAPGAPLLSLGHLVVVAMETTSKMACKSTQAITRERREESGEQRGRAGSRGLWREGLGTVWTLVSTGEWGYSGDKDPVPGVRSIKSSWLPSAQPQALTGARRGHRACRWGAGFWGRPLCQGKAFLARRHLTDGHFGGAMEDLPPNPGRGARRPRHPSPWRQSAMQRGNQIA